MVVLSALDQLMQWDRELLIWLNSFHVSWLDPVMFWITKTFFWTPLYLFLLYLMIRTYKKDWWIPAIGILITIVLADQITASIMKPYFMRLRPSQEPGLQDLLHLYTDSSGEIYRGGLYGFASSHAANTFATATFFTLLLGDKYLLIKWLFLWAVVMTYTRIYLGAHYPGDILVGGIVGVLSAITGYQLQKYIDTKALRTRSSTKT